LMISLAGATAGPLAVGAITGAQQTPSVRRVAFVMSTSSVEELSGDEPMHPGLRLLLKELRKLGWVEGQSLTVDRRSAEGRFDRFGDILRSVVSAKADVIITSGTDMAIEARRVTTTVPIVMTGVRDPLRSGLVSSLSRPGGNLTGISLPGPEFEGKRLEMLRQALPKARRVVVLQRKAFWEDTLGSKPTGSSPSIGHSPSAGGHTPRRLCSSTSRHSSCAT
jgi:ABC transporter substrate binding protein